MLLVNPGVAVSTAAVFGGWDGIDRGPREGAAGIAARGATISKRQRGRWHRSIGDVLDPLRRIPAPMLARMSGSGATCFALYDS